MADLPITILDSSAGDSGFKDLLRVVGMARIPSPRIWGRPLRFLNANYSRDLASFGKTVTVQVNPIVNTQLMTDGSATANDDTSPTAVDLTLNRIRITKFTYSQILSMLESSMGTFNSFVDSRITGLLNDVEKDVFSFVPTLTQNSGTYATDITEGAVLAGTTNITANSPPPAELIGLISPASSHSWSAFAQLQGVSLASYRGYQEMSPMVVGAAETGQGGIPWHGVNWFQTQVCPKAGSNVSNVIFHPYSIGYVNRGFVPPGPGADWMNFEIDGVQFQMIISWNKDTLSSECAFRSLYGSAVLNGNWANELRG